MQPYNRHKKEAKENTPLPTRRKKMFVLEYMWDDENIYNEAKQRNNFLFRYDELGVWYPQFAKYIDVDHVIEMIKKDLRSWIMTNQVFYLRMYAGKKWRIKNLTTGQYTYITITNNDVYVTEEEKSKED